MKRFVIATHKQNGYWMGLAYSFVLWHVSLRSRVCTHLKSQLHKWGNNVPFCTEEKKKTIQYTMHGSHSPWAASPPLKAADCGRRGRHAAVDVSTHLRSPLQDESIRNWKVWKVLYMHYYIGDSTVAPTRRERWYNKIRRTISVQFKYILSLEKWWALLTGCNISFLIYYLH